MDESIVFWKPRVLSYLTDRKIVKIAAPMLGGMLTVMILNLLVLPVIYSFVLQYQEKSRGAIRP